jgi:hypothetical protein
MGASLSACTSAGRGGSVNFGSQHALTARVSVERGAAGSHPAAARTNSIFDSGWPYAIAFGGIGMLALGGLVLRRKRDPNTTWPDSDTLGGDSHSKTNVGEVPVPFTQFGVSVEPPPSPHHSRQAQRATTAREALAAPAGVKLGVAAIEASQLEQEAHARLALPDVDRAIAALRAHIEREPRSLPAAWLMLLDLYRTYGREADFRQLAEDFHTQFNARAPQWDARLDAVDPGLEAHPHLIRTLGRLWGTAECRDFLDRLIHDNREGHRSGFTQAAYRDILALRALVQSILGEIDVTAEREVRAAWAEAIRQIAAANPPAALPAATAALDLESELDDEIRLAAGERSALERNAPERKTGADLPRR